MTQPKHRREFGSVRRLPSRRYQARYVAPNGQSVARTFPTRTDAEGFLVNAHRDIDTGRWRETVSHKVTFREYSEVWLRDRQVRGRPLAPRTREHYQRILDAHLLPTFGNRPVAAITPGDVKAWHAATLAGKPTLRSHAYGLLRSIMHSAVADELADSNPARIRGAGSTTRARRIRIASPAELAALTEQMPDRLRLLVTLGSWCALRFGEAIALTRGDIDLANQVVKVRRAVIRTADGQQVAPPKTAGSVRDVTIPPHVLPQIEARLAEYVGTEDDSPLFATEGGGWLQPATFYRHFYRARKAIGRDDLRFHDLRHSGATMAAQSGATLAELMDRLGHTTPTAALRYQHATTARASELAAKLSKLASL